VREQYLNDEGEDSSEFDSDISEIDQQLLRKYNLDCSDVPTLDTEILLVKNQEPEIITQLKLSEELNLFPTGENQVNKQAVKQKKNVTLNAMKAMLTRKLAKERKNSSFAGNQMTNDLKFALKKKFDEPIDLIFAGKVPWLLPKSLNRISKNTLS